jgi:hypothetical protein
MRRLFISVSALGLLGLAAGCANDGWYSSSGHGACDCFPPENPGMCGYYASHHIVGPVPAGPVAGVPVPAAPAPVRPPDGGPERIAPPVEKPSEK